MRQNRTRWALAGLGRAADARRKGFAQVLYFVSLLLFVTFLLLVVGLPLSLSSNSALVFILLAIVDLLLLLRYRLTQLGDVRHRVRCLAFEPGGAAFKLQETGAGYQALIDQRLNAFDLFSG